MPRYYLHQSYSRAERLKYWTLNEELQLRKEQGEKELVIKNGAITMKTFRPSNFILCSPVTMAGKSTIQVIFTNCCSLLTQFHRKLVTCHPPSTLSSSSVLSINPLVPLSKSDHATLQVNFTVSKLAAGNLPKPKWCYNKANVQWLLCAANCIDLASISQMAHANDQWYHIKKSILAHCQQESALQSRRTP